MTIGVTVGCMQVLLRAAGPLSGMRADLAGASVFPDTEVALPPQWLCDFGQISAPPKPHSSCVEGGLVVAGGTLVV